LDCVFSAETCSIDVGYTDSQPRC